MRANTGIIYMAFGRISAEAAAESLASIRALGINLPAISVGNTAVPGTTFCPWERRPPFRLDVPHMRQFQAGSVKPYLYKYSPWKYNLYLDADTIAIEDFTSGFDYLKEYDICIANDFRKTLEETYRTNKTGPEWDWARKERDFTSRFLGVHHLPMINTGVIFFKWNRVAREFFRNWHDEWCRFKHWDEQMAFLRAEKNSYAKILRLPPYWNEHDESKRRIFWHRWGWARDAHMVISGEKKCLAEE